MEQCISTAGVSPAVGGEVRPANAPQGLSDEEREAAACAAVETLRVRRMEGDGIPSGARVEVPRVPGALAVWYAFSAVPVPEEGPAAVAVRGPRGPHLTVTTNADEVTVAEHVRGFVVGEGRRLTVEDRLALLDAYALRVGLPPVEALRWLGLDAEELAELG